MFIIIEQHKDGFNVMHPRGYPSFLDFYPNSWGAKIPNTPTTKLNEDTFDHVEHAKSAVENRATKEAYGITYLILDLDAGKVVSKTTLKAPPLPWEDVK